MSADRLVAYQNFDFDFIVENDFSRLTAAFQDHLMDQNPDHYRYEEDPPPVITDYEVTGMGRDNTVEIRISGLTRA